MNFSKTRLFIGILILLIYISIGVFGLFEFNHMSEMPMVNCPYTVNNHALCSNNLEHINYWHQFSNIIFSSTSIFLFLILGIVLYFLSRQDSFNFFLRFFSRWQYYFDNKILFFYKNKIIKWLSLFENSPSLSYVRHS